MKTKHTATRRPTRKNKRIMSGGGKMSKITRRFKDHFKRFFKINENDKIKKCEAWGSLNGIFKFVEAQNEKYTGADGTELSGLDKMIGNINKTPNSSNKDRYIKAIDCFKKGCDTILSGDECVCVSYSDFVNGGGVAAPAPVEAPAAVATVAADAEAPVVSPAYEETNDSPVAPTVTENDADEGVNAAAEAVVPAAEAEVESNDAPVAAAAPKEETSAAVDAVQDDADSAEGTQSSDSPGVTQSGDAPEGSAATAVLDNNNNPDNTRNSSTTEDTEEDASQSQQPAASVDKSSEGGGRSRRHSRPSRRIKSRKSKKGRMTRRKHRAVRR